MRLLQFGAFLILGGLFSNCLFNPILAPGNRPPRGPMRMIGTTDTVVNHTDYAGQSGLTMKGYDQYAGAIRAHVSSVQGGVLVGAYTVPVYATDIPAGPMQVESSASCIFSVCTGESGAKKFRREPFNLHAISSVDVKVLSILFGIYTKRTVVITGWNKQAYQEKFGN